MSTRILFRVAAVALVFSGGSLALGLILHPMPPFAASIATARWAASHLFWWLGSLAGIAGIAGLYLRHREEVGVLGFAGSGLAVVALALIASAMYFEAFIAPPIATRAPELFEGFPTAGGWGGFIAGVLAGGAFFGVGFVLLGIGLARARGAARWAVAAAVLGGVPFAVNFLLPRPVAILAVVVFAAGLAGLSQALWRSAALPPAHAAPSPSVQPR